MDEITITTTETTETEDTTENPVENENYVRITDEDIKRGKRRDKLCFAAGAATGVGGTILYFKKIRPVLRDAREHRKQKVAEAKAAKKAAKEAAKMDSSEG